MQTFLIFLFRGSWSFRFLKRFCVASLAAVFVGILCSSFFNTPTQRLAQASAPEQLQENEARHFSPRPSDAKQTGLPLAVKEVTIYRDGYSVPHIVGKNTSSVVFGFAYAQAEDNFWQVEDSYILALGRYSEVHGPQGLNSDLLNRAFEIVRRSKADYPKLDVETQAICKAFTDGLNYYLTTHVTVRPRLIQKFEPWHVLAFYRHVHLELTYRYTHLSSSMLPRHNRRIWAQVGSNGWAISGARTKTGNAMLFVNPHLPFYGYGQLYEAHLICRSDSSDKLRQPGNSKKDFSLPKVKQQKAEAAKQKTTNWNFTGATFLGAPLLVLGHNAQLGWTLTTNEPDIADVWRLRFSDPAKPLAYEYDGGWKMARSWKEEIGVRVGGRLQKKTFTLRSTHLGPIVAKESETVFLAANICGLYDVEPGRQAIAMMQSKSLDEFKKALSLMQLPFMNILYADVEGNTFYLYGARAPKRNPKFDWSKPVDGSNPETAWKGIHPLSDLPQLLNPPSGFMQNCNSSPYITTDGKNPSPEKAAPYLVEDANAYKRRALRSLEILRSRNDWTLESLEKAAFDTQVYWAKHEMPTFLAGFDKLHKQSPQRAESVVPLIDLLKEWDGKITADSTAATLAEAWYEELYVSDYPGETLKKQYQKNPMKQMQALDFAAAKLERIHGTWKVPYSKIHRLQRQPNVADLFDLRFNDRAASVPCLAGYGPMGVIFTQYYTPSIKIPFVISSKKRYGVVGGAYMAVYEFDAKGVRGKSVVPYGVRGNPRSAHFFDQAELFAATRMKKMPFTFKEVKAAAVRTYHPGEKPLQKRKAALKEITNSSNKPLRMQQTFAAGHRTLF